MIDIVNYLKPTKQMKVYFCGWCGHPTNKKGEPFTGVDLINAENLLKFGKVDSEPLNGYCCPPEEVKEQRYVTREMAIDAGDPSLEGWPI